MTMSKKTILRRQRGLLRHLARELYQSETSTSHDARREHRRMGPIPPAWALAGVADHAESVLDALPALAERHGMPIGRMTRMTGQWLATLRQLVADRFHDGERSYRATLVSIRRGLDVVRMIHLVAEQLDDDTLADWCERWLELRGQLARRVEDELAWFAHHPGRAAPARAPLLEPHHQRPV
jgi:hypothetical protein